MFIYYTMRVSLVILALYATIIETNYRLILARGNLPDYSVIETSFFLPHSCPSFQEGPRPSTTALQHTRCGAPFSHCHPPPVVFALYFSRKGQAKDIDRVVAFRQLASVVSESCDVVLHNVEEQFRKSELFWRLSYIYCDHSLAQSLCFFLVCLFLSRNMSCWCPGLNQLLVKPHR